MRYCIDFYQTSRILSEVDEINIKYNKDNTHILDFLKEHPAQTINICLNTQEDVNLFIRNSEIELLSAIKENNPEWTFKVRLYNYEDNIELFEILKEKSIPVYFYTFINNWDILHGYIKLGVSDVYIVEDLGFDLYTIKKVFQNQVNIRVFPHIAQSTWALSSVIKKFYIRPDDIDLYNNVVDVCEFHNVSDKADAYYNIYKSGQWFGKLQEIILDFDSDLDGKYIAPSFAEQRIKCGKKCIKGGKCAICERIEELSKTLEKNNLVITIDKKKEEKNG